MKKLTVGKKRFRAYRAVLGMGIGIGSMALSLPAHASIPTEGCSDKPPASSANASVSSETVSRELMFLRRTSLTEDLGFERNKLIVATCSGVCNPDGSGSYSQEPGCTYTQTCGGGTKKPLQS